MKALQTTAQQIIDRYEVLTLECDDCSEANDDFFDMIEILEGEYSTHEKHKHMGVYTFKDGSSIELNGSHYRIG